MEIGNQKTRVRGAVTSGKKLLRDSSLNDDGSINKKIDQLKNKADAIGAKAAERLGELEQTLPLATSFHETHSELVTWLDEIEPVLDELEVVTVDTQEVKRQQETMKVILHL